MFSSRRLANSSASLARRWKLAFSSLRFTLNVIMALVTAIRRMSINVAVTGLRQCPAGACIFLPPYFMLKAKYPFNVPNSTRSPSVCPSVLLTRKPCWAAVTFFTVTVTPASIRREAKARASGQRKSSPPAMIVKEEGPSGPPERQIRGDIDVPGIVGAHVPLIVETAP